MKRKNIVFIIILLATVILGTVAVVTALKLREIGQEPVAPTAPESKPKAAEEPAAEPEGEDVDPNCVKEFTVSEEPGELVCESVEMIPDRESVEAEEERELEAIVSGGTSPYNYSWTIETSADETGSYSDETANPTIWTAPSDLTEDSEWTLEATVTDTEDNETTCSRTVSFSLEPGPSPSPSPDPSPSPSPDPSPDTSPSPKASPSPSARAGATPAPELPEAGIISPTIFAGVAGILLVVLGILL